MSPTDLLEWLNANPFEPFRIHLSDGRSFNVARPLDVLPGLTSAVVAIPSAGDPLLYERFKTISLQNMVSIEPLHPVAQSN